MKISPIHDFCFSDEPKRSHEKPNGTDLETAHALKSRAAYAKKWPVPHYLQQEFSELIARAQRSGIDLPKGALEALQRPGSKSLAALAGFAKKSRKKRTRSGFHLLRRGLPKQN